MSMTDVKNRIILDLCGGTGGWSRPYREAGYDVRIIDPQVWLPNNSGTGDVRLFEKLNRIKEPVYGVLSAPPCTEFAVSGAQWWEGKGEEPLLEGLSVVDACIRISIMHKPKFWALENPVGRLRRYLGDPTLIFQPCDYGDDYNKKTLLWGEFNDELEKNPVKPDLVDLPNGRGKMSRNYLESWSKPPAERARLRSETPPGFAQAFFNANQ